MLEVARAGEDQGQAEPVGGLYDLVVAEGASGLGNRGHAAFGSQLDPVGEWKEGVGSEHGPL